MSDDGKDDFFPGFQDDGKPSPKPSLPAAPPTAPAGGERPFNAFAEVAISAPGPGAASAPAAAPAAARAVAPVAPVASAAAQAKAQAEVDADLKPGSRKDLWKCLHCGAGNKPDRTTCRSCGKSPSDPVAAPWWRSPVGLMAIAGGLVVVVIAVLLMNKADLRLRSADSTSIDDAPRRDARIEAASLNGFVPTGRLAVTGRVIEAQQLDEQTLRVLLVLGPTARDAAKLPSLSADGDTVSSQSQIGATEQPSIALRLLAGGAALPSADELSKGSILSVVGSAGTRAETPGSGVILLPSALKHGK
jgi:hypothetical protein